MKKVLPLVILGFYDLRNVHFQNMLEILFNHSRYSRSGAHCFDRISLQKILIILPLDSHGCVDYRVKLTDSLLSLDYVLI